MHLFIASGLFIVCGIIDASIYNPRIRTFNQLTERRQRSIGHQYPHEYLYNPIEPSINDLDSFNEALDSRINPYNPIYQHVGMTTHDVNLVPKTHSYQTKNPIYDSEYITAHEVPSLFPEESYDYKYLGLPLSKHLTKPSTTKTDIPINLLHIRNRKTSVFGYGFPSYKSPFSSDSAWNLDSNIQNTIFGESQSIETNKDTFKASSTALDTPKILSEILEQEQEPTTTSTKYPYNYFLSRLLRESLIEDESINKITQDIPTEDKSNFITSEETQTEGNPNKFNVITIEENVTEDESNSITPEETQTEENSNQFIFTTTEENLTEGESNSITSEETQTEDNLNKFYFTTTEENLTEGESNSITSEETQTEDNSNQFNFITIVENLITDESNSITSEETQTEDNSNKFDFTTTEENLTEGESNSITSEETQTEDNSNKFDFTTSEEILDWNV